MKVEIQAQIPRVQTYTCRLGTFCEPTISGLTCRLYTIVGRLPDRPLIRPGRFIGSHLVAKGPVIKYGEGGYKMGK